MPPILRTDGLTKEYGQILALDHLCLDVDEGQVVGFLGPNGAGKTTTIRLLLDLIRPTSGAAEIGGFDCHRHSLRVRRLVGYLPGEMPVYPDMSAGAYLAYLGKLAAAPPDPAVVERLLRRFDVGPAQLVRPLRDLSHGTKRKLGIVQALMGEPRIAILDEPTSGLDPLMIEAFAETVNGLKGDGRTSVFLSSHVLSEVAKTCDRVAIVRDGRLMAVRTIHELVTSLPRRVTVTFAEKVSELFFESVGGRADSATSTNSSTNSSDTNMRVVSCADRVVLLEVVGPLGPLVERLAGCGVADIDVRTPSLEDYVLGLYRGEA